MRSRALGSQSVSFAVMHQLSDIVSRAADVRRYVHMPPNDDEIPCVRLLFASDADADAFFDLVITMRRSEETIEVQLKLNKGDHK